MGEPIGDKYRIDRVIGHGELAMAFEATHMVLGEKVALKVLLPRWADHQPLLARYLQQGRAAAHVHDEHVERVLDLGTHHEAPYLVTEYLEGKNLGELVEDLGPVAVPDAIDHVLQAIEALADGHAMGVDHKDLCTRDLFLTHRPDGSGCVKVLDFGISKARPRSADDLSGVWAVGGVLYELLAGLPPFLPSFGASTHPPRPLSTLRLDVPEALEATVMMCLERDPVERFRSVAEVALALPEFGSPWAHASVEKIVRALRSVTRPAFPGFPESPRRIEPAPPPSTLAPTTGTLAPPLDDDAELDGAWRRKSGLRFAAAGFAGLAALTAIFGWIALRMHESVTQPSAALPTIADTRLASPPAPPPPTTTAPPTPSPSKPPSHPPSPSQTPSPSPSPSPAQAPSPPPSPSSTANLLSRPSPAARSRGRARPTNRVERSDATEVYPITPAPLPPATPPPPPPPPAPSPSEIVTTSPFDKTTATAPPVPPPSSGSTGGAADPQRLFEDRK